MLRKQLTSLRNDFCRNLRPCHPSIASKRIGKDGRKDEGFCTRVREFRTLGIGDGWRPLRWRLLRLWLVFRRSRRGPNLWDLRSPRSTVPDQNNRKPKGMKNKSVFYRYFQEGFRKALNGFKVLYATKYEKGFAVFVTWHLQILSKTLRRQATSSINGGDSLE